MKKILLTGLSPTMTEDALYSWLNDFGTVCKVNLVMDGNAASPVAVIEMDITDAQAYFIVSRISNYWHNGALINASLLLH